MGRDGHCRAAIVKITTRDGQPEQLRRPIQPLYPLELKSPCDNSEMSAENATSSETVSPNEEPPTDKDGEGVAKQGTDTFAEPQRKSKCVAVQQGDECRKACMIKLNDD